MTIGEWLESATAQLAKVGIGSARLDAELILGHALKVSREEILAHPERTITPAQQTQINKLLASRVQRRPLVHLTGQREFYGLEFEITPNVLTPRVETERMVELAIEHAPQHGSLLDVGTGSGAIAVAIAKHRPDLAATAGDISDDALKVARRNAKRHGVKVKFVQSNLFEHITGRFGIITANLPYLPDDAELMPEVGYEPRVALLGGSDGLDLYRQFFEALPTHLNPGSLVIIEADPWQHADLIEQTKVAGLQVLKDEYFILTFTFTD